MLWFLRVLFHHSAFDPSKNVCKELISLLQPPQSSWSRQIMWSRLKRNKKIKNMRKLNLFTFILLYEKSDIHDEWHFHVFKVTLSSQCDVYHLYFIGSCAAAFHTSLLAPPVPSPALFSGTHILFCLLCFSRFFQVFLLKVQHKDSCNGLGFTTDSILS